MIVCASTVRAGAQLPQYMSEGAAGADLCACIDSVTVIKPAATAGIPTGIALSIPLGYVGLICARSGLATKNGLAPANKVGVIDSDYRGEIVVYLHNHSSKSQTVAPGQRIAQILLLPCPQARFVETTALDATERGLNGFGSTGL